MESDISAGIRKRYGLAIGLSVAENSVMASRELCPSCSYHKMNLKISAEYVDRLEVRTPSLDQLVKNLSGNQQKVVIANG